MFSTVSCQLESDGFLLLSTSVLQHCHSVAGRRMGPVSVPGLLRKTHAAATAEILEELK